MRGGCISVPYILVEDDTPDPELGLTVASSEHSKTPGMGCLEAYRDNICCAGVAPEIDR